MLRLSTLLILVSCIKLRAVGQTPMTDLGTFRHLLTFHFNHLHIYIDTNLLFVLKFFEQTLNL
jgi:hypothetical protein